MRSIQLFVVLVMLVACLLACVEATAAAGKPQRPRESQKPQKKGLHKRREAKRAEKHKAKKRAETRAETRAEKRARKKRAETRARKAITGKQQGRKLNSGVCHDGVSAPDGNGFCPCNDGFGTFNIYDSFDDYCDCCDCSDESNFFREQNMQCIHEGGDFEGSNCYLTYPDFKCDYYNDCVDGSDESECNGNNPDTSSGCLDAAKAEDVKTFLDAAITNGQTQAVLQAWSEAGSCN